MDTTLHPVEHRSPGDEAILFCSIPFQGQMVFASLTSTADVGLFASFSQVALLPLFQFILPLAPLLCSVSFITMAGRQLELSAGGCFFQGAGQTSFPQLSPPSPGEISIGAPRTESCFIEKLLIKKDGKGTKDSRDQKDACCHLASRLSLNATSRSFLIQELCLVTSKDNQRIHLHLPCL